MKMKAVAGNAKKQRGRRKRFLFPFPVPYVFHIYVSGSRVLRAECEDRDR